MAQLITGLQGSGKSYKAMHTIFYSQNDFYRTYSNLDKLVNTSTIFSLDFNSFVNYGLKECYKIMVSSNRDIELDDELSDEEIFRLITVQNSTYDDAIEHLKKINLLPSVTNEDNRILFIIDEAQDYFGKTVKISPELLWFITQHRHLYIEIILLTQDVSLIRPDYKLFNAVYDAVPPTKQFNKDFFTYHHYAGLPINEANYVGKIKLKKEQEIFALYHSGDKVDSPNILKRFIVIGIIALSIIFFSIYYLKSRFSHTEIKDDVITVSSLPIVVSTSLDDDYSQLKYLKLKCVSNHCMNKVYKIDIYIDDLSTLVIDTKSKILSTKKYSKSLAIINILATPNFLKLFRRFTRENVGFISNR